MSAKGSLVSLEQLASLWPAAAAFATCTGNSGSLPVLLSKFNVVLPEMRSAVSAQSQSDSVANGARYSEGIAIILFITCHSYALKNFWEAVPAL